MIYSEFLEVRECGKVTQGMTVESGRGIVEEPDEANTESLDEGKQTELV